jgi:hypothetical protein
MIDDFEPEGFSQESEILWNGVEKALNEYRSHTHYPYLSFVGANVGMFLVCKSYTCFGEHPEILSEFKNDIVRSFEKSLNSYIRDVSGQETQDKTKACQQSIS